jgi:dihydroneopterin aldolase
MNSKHASMTLCNLELLVYLGWPQAERSQQQIVTVDINIDFLSLPKACATDDLAHTFCYDGLVKHIKESIVAKNFHLLEYFTEKLYFSIKEFLALPCRINIRAHKKPPVADLKGGVIFHYGDA